MRRQEVRIHIFHVFTSVGPRVRLYDGMIQQNERLSVCPVCYYPKPVINDVIAAFSIHVYFNQCNYSLERKAWGNSLLLFFISWSK